jgi:hypothetical protein
VDFLDNQVDRGSGTIAVRAVLDNKERIFTPGLYTRVRLVGSGEFQAVLIDDKAVLTDQDRNYVYIVDKDGLAQRRDVQLGGSSHGLRIVREGLAAGDRVIVNGTQKVFLHRQADLRGRAVDRHLRLGPAGDPGAADQRVSRGRAALGRGARPVSRRQPQGDRRDRGDAAGGVRSTASKACSTWVSQAPTA